VGSGGSVVSDNKAIPVAVLERLATWHERRAKVKRFNAEIEGARTFNRGSLLGNADSHDVAASILRHVVDGGSVEGL
jgi:hypothetical protein